MTAFEISPVGPDEYAEVARQDGLSCGQLYTKQTIADIFDDGGPQMLKATSAGSIVGLAGEFRFTMTVPGGSLDVPGVTWVSVNPTRRRQGVLRGLMEHQLAAFRANGDPAAILTASQGGIYRRFGYGPASRKAHTVIHRELARLAQPGDTSRVEFLTAEAARKTLPELHRRWTKTTPGAISRAESWWNFQFLDRPGDPHRTPSFHLVHPDGYLRFKVTDNWPDGHAEDRCEIVDYRCVTAEAHAALWQVLLGMDLFSVIESWEIPVDDPLAFLLTDFRQVRTTALNDGVWLRPVDVPALLSARTYACEIDTVVELTDHEFAGRRFALAGGPDGATCRRTDQPSDIRFTTSALGSAYLGGYRPRVLAAAGMVASHDPAVLRRIDLAFAGDRAPTHGTAF